MTPYVEIMKRELVVFSVIGGLLWAATGISVVAVTLFDGGAQSSTFDQALAIDGMDPDRTHAGTRFNDEETSAPLCESVAADSTPKHLRQEHELRTADAQVDGGSAERCLERDILSLLRLCLLLT